MKKKRSDYWCRLVLPSVVRAQWVRSITMVLGIFILFNVLWKRCQQLVDSVREKGSLKVAVNQAHALDALDYRGDQGADLPRHGRKCQSMSIGFRQ